MDAYPIITPQSEIDSYIDMCNARPELARPTAQLPDGTLVAFTEVTVAEDSVSGRADADGMSYWLTLSRTPGASQLTEVPAEMLFAGNPYGGLENSKEEIASFVERFDKAKEKGLTVLPYARFTTGGERYIAKMTQVHEINNSLEFMYTLPVDVLGEIKMVTLTIRRDTFFAIMRVGSVDVQPKKANTLDTEAKTVVGAINELAARTKVEAVDALPESPDANTLYVIPASE